MYILTFDIEDWFHILDHPATRSETQWQTFPSRLDANIERILHLLASKNLKATFFCLGWVARKHPHIIRNIVTQGHEIGCHSHHHQLVFEMTPKSFAQDLSLSLNTLQEITGDPIRIFRAPGFSIGEQEKWVFEILAAHGIEADSSIFPAPRGHGGFATFGQARPVWIESNGIRIKEFPINLFSILGRKIIFSGGGYFRLLPYPLIQAMTQRSPYVMTYFHPRDFDPGQPLVPNLPLIRRFKSYYGLQGAFNKLQRLVDQFSFVSLESAEQTIDWQNAPVIHL
jgi:polysaccharide deacetylase family protein (PEP-CTERM system associated)